MRTRTIVDNYPVQVKYITYTSLVFIILFLISALRSFDVGTDTISYVQGYINPRISIQNRNIGYNLFVDFLRYFSTEPRFFLISVSLITQVFIFLAIIKFTRYPLFGIILYGLIFYCLSLNILRQFIVTSLFYYFGIPLIQNRKLIHYALLIALLFTIHELSLILLPLYFFSRKLSSKVLYLGIWGFSLAFLLLNQVSNLFTYLKRVDVFLKAIISNLPNYFSEIDKLANSEASLNGVLLDQAVFLIIYYLIFYSKRIVVNQRIIIFFNIFFVGIIFQNLFFFISVIQRLSLLLIFANIFLSANLLYRLPYRLLFIAVFFVLFYIRFVVNGISGIFH